MKNKIYILAGLFVLLFWTAEVTNAQEDVGRLLQELENNTDRFSASFRNAVDNSDINGTSTEDEATRFVKQFEDSIDHLKRQFDEGKDTKIAAQESLARAKVINGVMDEHKLDATSQTDWKSVKVTIARLAKHHNLKLDW